MYSKKMPLFIFCILLFIIYTPQKISDKFYGKIIGDTTLNYYDYDNNNIRYIFNHKNYDGELMAHVIKNNLFKYTLSKNISNYEFKKHQYLNSKRIENYSIFTSAVSYLLHDMMYFQRRSLKIGIVVSLRHKCKDINKKGNFIKLATYTVTPNDTLLGICKIHNDSVKYIKNKNYLRYNSCFLDLLRGFQCDYIFNSWRSLTCINTVENKNLIRQRDKEVKKIDVKKLIHIPSWQYIILDYIDGNYILGDIIDIENYVRNDESNDLLNFI
tara:strand:+ start:1966 stop:2775 length:810 start_codon:yes stop_codon:yes gene_type:complete